MRVSKWQKINFWVNNFISKTVAAILVMTAIKTWKEVSYHDL